MKEQITKKHVLVPPIFGLGCDLLPPPLSRPFSSPLIGQIGNNNNNILLPPNQSQNNRTTTNGSNGSFIERLLYSPKSSCANGMSLLSSEHMVVNGIFISASSPGLDGNVTAHYKVGNNNNDNGNNKRRATTGIGGINVAKLFHVEGNNMDDDTGSTSSIPFGGLNMSVNTPTTQTVNNGDGNAKVNADAFLQKKIGKRKGNLSCFVSLQNEETPELIHTPSREDNDRDCNNLHAQVGWQYNSENGKSIPGDAHSTYLQLGSSTRWSLCSLSGLLIPSSKTSNVRLDGLSSYIAWNAPQNGVTAAIGIDLPIIECQNRSLQNRYGQPLQPSLSNIWGDWKSDLSSLNQNHTTNELFQCLSSRIVKPDLSYVLSCDLNRLNSIGSSNHDRTRNSPSSSTLPIILTLHQTVSPKMSRIRQEKVTAVTVSQVFTYDRIITNPLEERCSKIRNTISWAVQLSQNQSVSQNLTVLNKNETFSNSLEECNQKVMTNTNTNLTAALG